MTSGITFQAKKDGGEDNYKEWACPLGRIYESHGGRGVGRSTHAQAWIRGSETIRYIKPLSMTLYGGGEAIENVREIREYRSLREVIELDEIPSSSATGGWLKRVGVEGMEGGRWDGQEGIEERWPEGGKRGLLIRPGSSWARERLRGAILGFKGYRPVVVTLKEIGLVIAYEFREENDNGGRLEILEKVFSKMLKAKRSKRFFRSGLLHERSDGVFEGEKGLAIGVDKDYPVIEAVRAISEEKWKPFKTRDGIITDREVAKAIHTMNKGKVAFRLVVLWWKERQGDLFRGAYHFY